MTITLTEAQHRLQSIALDQGDVVRGGDYETCSYFFHDGTPNCLVGAAFAAELAQAGVKYDSDRNDEGISDLVEEGVIDIEPLALAYLDAAQAQQDLGANWNAAVLYAEQVVSDRLIDQQLIAA